MTNKTRRLPDGGTTTDVEVYAQAWTNLCEEVAGVLGLTVHSCDPGVRLFSKEDNCMIDIPVSVARKIISLAWTQN